MKENVRQSGGTRLLKKGSRGDEVRELQRDLGKLGFSLQPDGIFGDETEKAVIQLQTLFGYTVDGLVGEGTRKLVTAQIGYGWNINRPDAKELAMNAQRSPGSHGKQGGASNANAAGATPPQFSPPQPGAPKKTS